MMRDLSIHVTFGSSTAIVNCPRAEFLPKICESFKVKEDEIEIYEKKSGRKIGLEDLSGVMKVEIRRKHFEDDEDDRSSPEPSTSVGSRFPDLTEKLRDNRTLTGAERKYLIDFLQTLEEMKENKENQNTSTSTVVSKPTRNVKIQVYPESLVRVNTIETQTDETLNIQNKRPSATPEVLNQSKRLAATEKADPVKVKALMDQLYDERRSFILLKLPLVSFVKEKYPLLFSLAEVRNEIDRILHVGKSEQFIRNIGKLARAIFSMAREDDPLLRATKEKMATLSSPSQKKYALEVGSILMLSALMNEDRGFLKLIDHPCETSNLPYIEAEAELNAIYCNQHVFRIIVEGDLLCEASNFKQAILCLIGSYYIFNIRYPDSNWNTFTAFEQLYLERVDGEELDDFALQIIGCVRLKAQALANK